MATNLIGKSRVNHKGIDSDLVIVMLDPDLFIVMFVLWKHLVFSAFWQERIYQSFQAFRWSFKKTQRKLKKNIYSFTCVWQARKWRICFYKELSKKFCFREGWNSQGWDCRGYDPQKCSCSPAAIFCYSVALVSKWFYWEFLDQYNAVVSDLWVYSLWLSEFVFPLFNPCGQTKMVAVKANFKFQLKFDVVIHEHYLLQVFEDHGCLFSKFPENCCRIHHHLHTCISVARN